MPSHDFTQGPPTSLAADELADAEVDAQLGRRRAPAPDVDDVLGLNDVEPDETDNSDLEAIRGELVAGGGVDTKLLEVEGRPGYAVEFRLDFTSRDVDRIRKAAHDRTFADKVDGIKFAALLLAKTCVAIHRNGAPIELDGRPATFTEPEFLDLLKRDGERQPVKAVDGVRRFYVLEGRIEAHARTVMEAASWGDEAREVDPTV